MVGRLPAAVLALTLLCGCAETEPPPFLDRLPRVVLWTWDRPEDLRFIDPDRCGVAALVGTVTLAGDHSHVAPRSGPVLLPTATALVATVRVEMSRDDPPVLSPDQRQDLVSTVFDLASGDGVVAVQVDFDAPVSARAFYSSALVDLRRTLPGGVGLSMTALASWCVGDRWLAGLPVDEVVPMLFRMGSDGPAMVRSLSIGPTSQLPQAVSLGIATDEALDPLPPASRYYVFHPEPWSETAYRAVLRFIQEDLP